MTLANTKKAQTIRNLWWTRVARPVLEAQQVVMAIRGAIMVNDLEDEFTTAEKDAMLAVEADLWALAGQAGITAAEGKHRPHHATEQNTVGLEI